MKAEDEKKMPENLPEFDSLWDYDKPEETEKKFRELLPNAKTSGNNDYHIQLLTQIARSQGLQRKFDNAHRTLDEAESLITSDLTVPKIRYLLERGRVFNSSGRAPESRPLFLKAWEIAKSSHHDFYAVDAAHMMAIIEVPEHQHEWNLKAAEIASESLDPRARRWLPSLYNNMGWTFNDAHEYAKALDMFRKALAQREEQGNVRETRIAKWCVAKSLRALNRLEEALLIQRGLLGEYGKDGEKSGYVYEELGENLLALKKEDEARGFFALAYQELSKDPWLVANESDRLKRLNELGGTRS